jgi:2-dehydro-3-deoxygalactonokinase
MFKLLSEYSVLKNSLKRADQLDKYSFNLGVNQSKDNILNRAFSIRAMSILSKQKNICNYSFLSGLLIGSELNDLKYTNVPIYLCAHKNLSANYALAMEQLSLGERCTVIQPQVVDNSVIHGQILFFKSVFC